MKTALISVSDKKGIVEFASGLHKLGIKIISTGGTAKTLIAANISVTPISEITDFPEIMNGRVKTLHPKIHGAILGKRDQHESEAKQHDINWIDLVVCNLYPFADTIKTQPKLEQALEQIDIGGPSMIRSAAKNFPWVTVIISPDDYAFVLEKLQNNDLSIETRRELAAKAFGHTAQYDAIIADYLAKEQQLTLSYGENPHQQAYAYQEPLYNGISILNATQHQGKTLSYNNLVDADAAIACIKEFDQPACVVVKHTNACGAAQDQDINHAFTKAWQADDMSAFGSVIALNRRCTGTIAEHISKVFVEMIIAPDFEPKALSIFQTKPKLRVMSLNLDAPYPGFQPKHIMGGTLMQAYDNHKIAVADLTIVTKNKPDPKTIADLLFAWKIVKHIKSNAIVIAKDNTTLGVGPGQTSRVGAVAIALHKAGAKLNNAVLASDAFFPFRDSIDALAASGIKAVIQPGGSIRDQEIIDACNEHGIIMVFTGIRCFKH